MAENKKAAFSLQALIMMALCVALSILLERLLGYNDKVISVSFGFVPLALYGMLYGIVPGMLCAAAADMLAALLFPVGPFNPLFTAVAALQGVCYGYFLHTPGLPSRARIIVCQVLVTFVLHLLFHTLIIMSISGKALGVLLPIRAFKNVLFFPVEVFALIKLSEYRPAFTRLMKR